MARTTDPGAPLLELDRRAGKAFKPYRESLPIKAVSLWGGIGDQPQIRLLAAGLVIAGLVRRDPRLLAAGARMLASHELATLAKNAVKHRVDRHRPRSNAGKPTRPKKGRHRAKEKTSFPSGHSAGAMAAASALAAVYPEHRGKALAAGASIGVAQVPTCAHYPSDVAAGLTIGALADAAVGLALRGGGILLRQFRPR